jgi:Aspartate/tyrosine/aromatic aminotransferase
MNNPNNPTSTILDKTTLTAIARITARHKLWLLCNKVYKDL